METDNLLSKDEIALIQSLLRDEQKSRPIDDPFKECYDYLFAFLDYGTVTPNLDKTSIMGYITPIHSLANSYTYKKPDRFKHLPYTQEAISIALEKFYKVFVIAHNSQLYENRLKELEKEKALILSSFQNLANLTHDPIITN